jgi:hypothetical protein
MPISFFFIVGAQLAIYLAIVAKRHSWREGWRGLWIGLLAGLPIGAIFDLIAGRLGIHEYIGVSGYDAFCRCGLGTVPLIVNGALSYGLAIATASLVPLPRLPRGKRGIVAPLISGFAFVLASVGIYFAGHASFAVFFSTGIAIVALCELVLLLTFGNAYFTYVFKHRGQGHLLRAWRWIVAIALLYETVNAMFPFWSWLPGNTAPRLLIESFVIAIAYIGLFYPMFAFWRFVRKDARE